MKKIISLMLIICIAAEFCGCDISQRPPVTLADSMSIPKDGIISAEIFDKLQQENKAETFVGQSNGVRYAWVIFGSDISEAADTNLRIEITQASGNRVEFRFASEKSFGFSPVLSIYLNDLWCAQGASLRQGDATQTVSVSVKKQSVLTFSPILQIGECMIVPDGETSDCASDSDTQSDDASQISDVSNDESPCEVSEEKRPVSDGTTSGQDIFHTDPVPEGKPLPVEPEDSVDTEKIFTCTFSIECSVILNNLDDLLPEKLDVLPSDGIILPAQTVKFYDGESVFDVLQRVCRENGIHMEASWTPMYGSAYVEGINNIYEFDCGSGSGWMYRVDGWYPNYGCSRYRLKQGEKVEWRYTCDLGKDIGGGYAVGD